MRFSSCLTALSLLAIFANPLLGDEPKSSVPDQEMMEAAIKEIAAVNDRTFNQYVDLGELDAAWTYLDAEVLADIGIQLAEAERILFRTHDAVKSKDILKIAVRTASVTGVKAALDKLKAYAEKTDNGEMVQQIKLASQLAGKSRSVAPSLSLDDVSLGAFIAYKQAQHDLNAALVIGDLKMLEELNTRVGKYAEKEPAIWKKLSGEVSEQYKNMKALGAPSRGGPNDVSTATDSLNKISGVTRGNAGSTPQKSAVVNGVQGALMQVATATQARPFTTPQSTWPTPTTNPISTPSRWNTPWANPNWTNPSPNPNPSPSPWTTAPWTNPTPWTNPVPNPWTNPNPRPWYGN